MNAFDLNYYVREVKIREKMEQAEREAGVTEETPIRDCMKIWERVLEEEESMELNMDSIRFESRAEIGEIITALEQYQKDHGCNDTVTEMIEQLDAMGMSW